MTSVKANSDLYFLQGRDSALSPEKIFQILPLNGSVTMSVKLTVVLFAMSVMLMVVLFAGFIWKVQICSVALWLLELNLFGFFGVVDNWLFVGSWLVG